jgi:5'-3' exonuclease
VNVYLVDGTYELFRHYYAVPASTNDAGEEVGATRGVVRSILGMLDGGATHIGVATDHVIESFRNELWPGYRTSAGVPDDLFHQFPMLEDALQSLGVAVWPMVEYEADDALAAAGREAAEYASHVLICTPDKDLGQCVVGQQVVQLDRRSGVMRDETGVLEKFGVEPMSIPDYLALVGDKADGYPGIPGFGAKTAASLLRRYGHIEELLAAREWDVPIRNAAALQAVLQEHRDLALLFKDLATLRADVPIDASEKALRWRGPRRTFGKMSARLGAPELAERAKQLAGVAGPREQN